MKSCKYLSVKEYAEERNVNPSTVYRWLKKDPHARDERIFRKDGTVEYPHTVFEEAFRRAKVVGVRDVQHLLYSQLRDLKCAGFAGYAVSNIGRVFNLNTQRQLKARQNSSGYQIVDLGSYGTQYVHRLVAFGWMGLPRKSTDQVDHKNGNKRYNFVENLEWVTPKENLKRAAKARFQNPRTPNKYTRGELGKIMHAVAADMSYTKRI